MLRRALLPVRGATLKIAAIERRSQFQQVSEQGDYVGIELGADMTADLNLDDFMVFDNDADRATQFFRELIYKHFCSVADPQLLRRLPTGPAEFTSHAFTQKKAFEELVRAAEGVPRDAINVLSLSAQRAVGQPIGIEHVRYGAKTWYQRDKEAAVSANSAARDLLHRIVDKVIGHRRARAFLFRSGARFRLIESLFDARVLHVSKRSVSAHDQPGARYDVYKIDYGCYVDLLATQRAPLGLLKLDCAEESGDYVEVPPDDYRAIRRAILEPAELDLAQ